MVHTIVFVYDISKLSSLKSIEELWIPISLKNANSDVKLCLVGNKSDSKREVQSDVRDSL